MKLPVTLSPAIVEASGQSQYHQRTRVGYWPSELDMLNTFLGQQNLGVDRVGCRLSTLHPASQIEAAAEIELDRIGGIDWYLDFVSEDDSHNARVIAEALGSIARHPPMRLVVGPHVDLDRSMDVAHGLIDRLSNPRSPLVVARMLSSLLFEISDVDVILPGMDPVDPGENRVYVLPGAEDGSQSLPQSMSGMFDEGRSATVYALELALSWEVTSSAQAAEILTGIIGPAAICIGTRAATA